MSELKAISELFGISAKGSIQTKIPGRYTPGIVEDYVFRPELLRIIFIWLFAKVANNLYLTGPTGAGKSSAIEQVAARLGLGVLRVGCHNRMELSDLTGRYVLNAFGGMEFANGPLIVAMREGLILLLDEVDLLPPAVAMGLNAALDGAPYFIPETGELVAPHPDFHIAVTGNTAGGGDAAGVYRGTVKQNLAWMDRFIAMSVDYMEASPEEALLCKMVPTLPVAMARGMVKVASEVRRLFMGQSQGGLSEELNVTLSSRTLATWAKVASALTSADVASPLREALQVVLLNKAEPSVAAAIDGIAARVLGGMYRDDSRKARSTQPDSTFA